jgi:hypothetical protein
MSTGQFTEDEIETIGVIEEIGGHIFDFCQAVMQDDPAKARKSARQFAQTITKFMRRGDDD